MLRQVTCLLMPATTSAFAALHGKGNQFKVPAGDKIEMKHSMRHSNANAEQNTKKAGTGLYFKMNFYTNKTSARDK